MVPAKTDVPENEWESLALPLIHQFEGFEKNIGNGKVKSYLCPARVWTIGYGTTGPDVGPATVWTHAEAKERSARDIAKFANGVEHALGGSPATAAQFAAMVSLAYNIGLGAFSKSTLLKRHKAKQYDAAAREFLRWNRGGGKVLAGLTRRREAEAGLYRKGSV